MPEMIGMTLLNRYRVDSFIGRGGMAEVYKVWDQERAVFLAMKLLREDLAEDVVFLRRFKREAENLARMQHPHIVRSYGLERQGRIAFLLMDYVEGSTLRGEVFDTGKPIPLQRVLAVMRPVCSALHYAHQMGMVHCDIKPANIMIEASGRVLVADFGIARMTDAATATMVGAGTPAYMAPEQVRGEDPTPQTDIYALGVVLYEMLTGGERPFTGEHAQTTGSTSEKVRWEQMHRAPPSPRCYNQGISPELEAVVMRCLEKDPGKRYPNTLDLLNALSLAMGEVKSPDLTPDPSVLRRGGEADKPRQGGEVARRSKRNLLLLGIGGIAVVVVLGVMLVADIWGGNQGQRGEGPLAMVTSTALPTNTSIPTRTPLPTTTATLTATLTPTILPPAPLEGLLEGVEVVGLETFDNLENWNLYNAKIMDGSVGFDETLPPGGSIVYGYEFEEGEGVLFNIQYTGTRAGIYGYCFENGVYQTDYDKQFCVSQFQYPYIFRGKEYIGLDTLRGQGTVNIKKNTWITVLHVVAPGGTFFTAFWVADDPSRIATKYYDGHYANWSDMAWTFDIYREDQNKTPFIVDDFMLIKFKELIVKK